MSSTNRLNSDSPTSAAQSSPSAQATQPRKYIKAVLTFMIPKDVLTPAEQENWNGSFEQLRHEIAEEAPDGVIANLVVSEVEQ